MPYDPDDLYEPDLDDQTVTGDDIVMPGNPTEQELATGVSELSPEAQQAAVEQYGKWRERDRDATRVVPEEGMGEPVRLDGSDTTRQIRDALKGPVKYAKGLAQDLDSPPDVGPSTYESQPAYTSARQSGLPVPHVGLPPGDHGSLLGDLALAGLSRLLRKKPERAGQDEDDQPVTDDDQVVTDDMDADHRRPDGSFDNDLPLRGRQLAHGAEF
jgi:hypothetical protein